MTLENEYSGEAERRGESEPALEPANWADVVSVAAEDWQCADVAALLALLFTTATDDCRRKSSGISIDANDNVALSEHLAKAAIDQGIDGHALCVLVEGDANSGAAAVEQLMGPFARQSSASAPSPAQVLMRIRESWEQLKHLRKVQKKLPPHRFLPLLYEFLGCGHMP